VVYCTVLYCTAVWNLFFYIYLTKVYYIIQHKVLEVMFICHIRVLKPICYNRPMYRMHVWIVTKKFILCLEATGILFLWFNPSNAELNATCHLLALLGAHHILHISRIRVQTCCAVYSPPPTKYHVLHNFILLVHIIIMFYINGLLKFRCPVPQCFSHIVVIRRLWSLEMWCFVVW
jgi:hypothetical protein